MNTNNTDTPNKVFGFIYKGGGIYKEAPPEPDTKNAADELRQEEKRRILREKELLEHVEKRRKEELAQHLEQQQYRKDNLNKTAEFITDIRTYISTLEVTVKNGKRIRLKFETFAQALMKIQRFLLTSEIE